MSIKASLHETKQSAVFSIKDFVNRHANIVTGFVALLIFIAGAGVVNGEETWWVAAAALGVAFVILFIILNARVVIKSTLAVIIVGVLANMALQIGPYVSYVENFSLIWMAQQFFLFFSFLAISYLVSGHRSRWTATIVGLFSSFLFTSFVLSYMETHIALLLSIPFSFIAFFMYYSWWGILTSKEKHMPAFVDKESVHDAIVNQAKTDGWNVVPMTQRVNVLTRKKETNFLLWNDRYAFVVRPTLFESELQESSQRRSLGSLTYHGFSLNKWLLSLTNHVLPSWRSRNASMMLVLLDVDSTNGTIPRAVGVSLPDSKRRLPVGVYPGRVVTTKKGAKLGVLPKMAEAFGQYLSPLSEKQRQALGEINVKQKESSYLEEE